MKDRPACNIYNCAGISKIQSSGGRETGSANACPLQYTGSVMCDLGGWTDDINDLNRDDKICLGAETVEAMAGWFGHSVPRGGRAYWHGAAGKGAITPSYTGVGERCGR
jgi:hypothetical protein